MIDLKELERSLDEALANETSESLSNWLIDQRKDNLASFLGVGCFEQFKGSPYSFNQNITPSVQFKVKIDNSPGGKFAIAA